MKLGGFRTEAGRDAYLLAYARAMALLPPPAGSREVETDFGVVKTYQWTGTRERAAPLFLLPGRSSGTPMWADNLPGLLASGRTVIAVDALGDAGLSVQSAPLRSFADQAVWMDQVLGRLGVQRVHSVGHSFGGAMAACHALRHPGRIASLALLEPVFTFAWPPVSTLLWTTLLTIPAPRRWRERALAEIGGVDVAEVRRATPMSEMIATGAATFRAALPIPKVLSDAELRSLPGHTYVAIAERKSLAGGRKAADRARAVPGGRAEIWPGTTHSLPMQVADRLAARLARHWDAVDR
jgi:pimeloyl-ACP methyl ester carboxylesterase